MDGHDHEPIIGYLDQALELAQREADIVLRVIRVAKASMTAAARVGGASDLATDFLAELEAAHVTNQTALANLRQQLEAVHLLSRPSPRQRL